MSRWIESRERCSVVVSSAAARVRNALHNKLSRRGFATAQAGGRGEACGAHLSGVQVLAW